MHMKRKGFTLTELLITIAAIAVMLTMFMLSSVNASRSADYNKVITNLRNLSIAAMTYYSQNVGKNFTGDSVSNVNITADVKKYLSNITGLQDGDKYYVYINVKDTPHSWWAGFDVQTSNQAVGGKWSTEETALSARLAARAKTLNLRWSDGFGDGNLPKVTGDDNAKKIYQSGKKYVWMLIRTGK